jgi:hypothetical protein
MELVPLVQVEFIKILIRRNRVKRVESLSTHHRIEVFLHFKQVVEKHVSKNTMIIRYFFFNSLFELAVIIVLFMFSRRVMWLLAARNFQKLDY